MLLSLTRLFPVALLAASHLVSAIPVVLRAEFIAFNPTVTSPKAGDHWVGGTQQTVTWRTDNIPPELSSSNGLLLLGYDENNNENLDIHHPLASRFLLTDGTVTFNVPQVADRTDYIVVLFGDSGNKSPQITITNSSDSSGSLGFL